MKARFVRPAAVNVAVLVGAVILALVLAEGLLRLSNAVPSSSLHTATTQEFDQVPGIFAPDQKALLQQVSGLPHHVRINSLGYRGADFPLKKPTDELRVVLLGDSFTFGEHVNDDDTLPRRLETALGSECGGIRVVNAGVGGTTISDQIYIAERSLAIDPDLTVLVFYENDVINLAGPRMWDELAANRARKSKPPFSVVYRYTRSTALWTLMMRMRGYWRTGGERQDLRGMPDSNRDRDRSALRARYAEGFRELTARMAAERRPFAVTAFPSHLTVSGASSRDQIEWISALADESGVPYFEIARELQETKRATTDLYLLPLDGHASPAGYDIAARALARSIRNAGMLSPSCAAA